MSGTTLAWLRTRDDDALAALLRARPDLTIPAPATLEVLANRLDTPPSVWRAMESLDRFAIQVLEALTLVDAHLAPVKRSEVTALFNRDAPAATVGKTLDRLERLGLVRGGAKPGLPRAVAEALGPHPARLGRSSGLPMPEAITKVGAAGPEAQSVLLRLADGPPVGTVGSGAQIASVVAELLEAGLLLRLDHNTVELPREVGLAVRGAHPLGPVHTTPPDAAVTSPGVRTVDGTGAGQALAAVSAIGRLVIRLGTHPVPALKTGGMGIRDLRKLAKDLGTEAPIVALQLELLAASGLITTTEPRAARAVNAWTPTHAADEFLTAPDEAAWAQLAEVWLDLRRDPARVGEKDATGKLLNVLAPELSWIRGPADRRFVLDALASLPAGSGLGRPDLAERLAWQAPLRDPQRRESALAATITEATALGVVAFDAITSAGRALLAGDVSGAAEALGDSLPAPVETVMVQADLTVVAPGRLAPGLAARLEQAADIESAGSATVYRVTPGSLRRALDSGASTAELHALFADHSATGVPQALTYLIDDTARRHGVLRTGIANSYLRSDDPALIAQAVTAAKAVGISLRTLAPTVAVCAAEVEDLMAVLTAAGLAPAAEDAGGAVLDLRAKPQRTKASLLTHQRWREPAVPSDEQIATLVKRMRGADEAAAGQSPSDALALLRQAANHRTPVWIGYVTSEGGAAHRIIEPVAVSGGTVAAFDRLREQMRTFALHRITEVRPLGPDESTAPEVETAQD